MFEWMKNAIQTVGYPGLVFFVFLENVFPPIPSEVIIPFGGFLVVKGDMNFILVVLAGTAGSVLGALPLYYLGRYLNRDRMKYFFNHKGKFLMVDEDNVDRSYAWFHKHGEWAVFICRMIPGLRSYVSIPAGSAKMGMPRFLALTAGGTAIWTAFLAWLGTLLGNNYEKVSKYLDPVMWGVTIIIVLSIAWWIFKQWRKKEKRKQGEHGDETQEAPASQSPARPGEE
jgi:membrane protein DedA with SNARE-associated domain